MRLDDSHITGRWPEPPTTLPSSGEFHIGGDMQARYAVEREQSVYVLQVEVFTGKRPARARDGWVVRCHSLSALADELGATLAHERVARAKGYGLNSNHESVLLDGVRRALDRVVERTGSDDPDLPPW